MIFSLRLEAKARDDLNAWKESNVGWEYLTQIARCANNQTTEYVNPWKRSTWCASYTSFESFCDVIIASYLPLIAMNRHLVFRPP